MMDKKDAIDYLLYMKHDVLANSPYDVALDTAIEALKATVKQPKTNADRIRQMTDEELAEMVSMKVCRIVKPDGSDCPKGFYFGKCDKCVLKWLKQEVSGYAAERTD